MTYIAEWDETEPGPAGKTLHRKENVEVGDDETITPFQKAATTFNVPVSSIEVYAPAT